MEVEEAEAEDPASEEAEEAHVLEAEAEAHASAVVVADPASAEEVIAQCFQLFVETVTPTVRYLSVQMEAVPFFAETVSNETMPEKDVLTAHAQAHVEKAVQRAVQKIVLKAVQTS